MVNDHIIQIWIILIDIIIREMEPNYENLSLSDMVDLYEREEMKNNEQARRQLLLQILTHE